MQSHVSEELGHADAHQSVRQRHHAREEDLQKDT